MLLAASMILGLIDLNSDTETNKMFASTSHMPKVGVKCLSTYIG